MILDKYFLKSNKFKYIFGLINMIIGIQMLIKPENTSMWFLQVMGLIWMFEGIAELYFLFIKSRLKNK